MTEFTDVQLALVIGIVAAVALFLLLDYRIRQDAEKQLQRLRPATATPERIPTPVVPLPAFSQRYSAEPIAHPRRAERRITTMPAVAPRSATTPKIAAHPRQTVTIEIRGRRSRGSSRPAESEALPAFTIDAELWERLISSMPGHDLLTAGDEAQRPEPPNAVKIDAVKVNYEATDHVLPSEWPAGIIPQTALEKLLSSPKPFSGQVVSIGVNHADSQELMHSIAAYVGELLRPNDFCCRSDYDEFVLACPGETGAPAQRRLSQIAERLWDFQLRGVGAGSILFSWGAVQVQDQPLGDAIASAVDRMRQTRRLSTGSTLTRTQPMFF